MDLYILACAVFLAVFCLPSTEGTAFHIHTEDKLDENNDCVKHVKVEGDGIADTFTTSCRAQVNQESLLRGILVIGDYAKDRVSVFSDTPSIMVVIHGEGKRCDLRRYTKGTKEVESLSDKECGRYKGRVSAVWKGSRRTRSGKNRKHHLWWKRQSKGIVNEDMYVITSIPQTKEGEKCTGSMIVGRSKLNYAENYEDCRARKVTFIQEGMMIGDYRTLDGITRVSDAVNSLVSVYKDKICDKMVFTKRGGSWALHSQLNLDKEQCKRYEKKIDEWLGNESNAEHSDDKHPEEDEKHPEEGVLEEGSPGKGETVKVDYVKGDSAEDSDDASQEDSAREDGVKEDPREITTRKPSTTSAGEAAKD